MYVFDKPFAEADKFAYGRGAFVADGAAANQGDFEPVCGGYFGKTATDHTADKLLGLASVGMEVAAAADEVGGCGGCSFFEREGAGAVHVAIEGFCFQVCGKDVGTLVDVEVKFADFERFLQVCEAVGTGMDFDFIAFEGAVEVEAGVSAQADGFEPWGTGVDDELGDRFYFGTFETDGEDAVFDVKAEGGVEVLVEGNFYGGGGGI